MTWIQRVPLDGGGVGLCVYENWSAEVEHAISKNDFDRLNIGNGQWTDFDFLGKYANLLARLRISSPVDSFRGIEKLINLRELELDDAPSPPLDLTVFEQLEKCYLYWHKRYSPKFFALPKLVGVTLSHYTEKDCNDIAQAKNLVHLDLRQGSVRSLHGIEHLHNLKKLSLAYLRNLEDVSSVASLSQLEEIHIEKCPKVLDVEFIRDFHHLRKLHIDCGSPGFADLQWMSKLDDLVTVLIALPVQSVDWNIVFALPNLQRVVINTHPGYQITDDELFACAKTHGRVLGNYFRAGTKKHPAFKFWMEPK